MWVSPLDQGDPLEKKMATHSNILAWKIQWTEESGGLQSMGLQRVGHSWILCIEIKYVGWQYIALYSFPNFEPVCCSMSVLTVASWPTYRFLRRQIRWSGFHMSLRIFQFAVIHSQKLSYRQWNRSRCFSGIPLLSLWPNKCWQFDLWLFLLWGFPCSSVVKNMPAMQEMQETLVHSLGQEDLLQNSCLQYSCLQNPMGRGAWWAIVHKIAKSWTCLKWLNTQHTHTVCLF